MSANEEDDDAVIERWVPRLSAAGDAAGAATVEARVRELLAAAAAADAALLAAAAAQRAAVDAVQARAAERDAWTQRLLADNGQWSRGRKRNRRCLAVMRVPHSRRGWQA